MEDLNITKRHRRFLSSLFFVLEQKAEAIEHMLLHPAENASYVIKQDLNEEQKVKLRSACTELKEALTEISQKLGLSRRKISQSQYINTIQSQMWENISDAFSDKLQGYGSDMIESAKITDQYIDLLSEKIDKLRF
jgi:uncharacterized phage infection (PIP) family protein YhgE